MKNLQQQLEAKALAELKLIYYDKINKFIDDFITTFHISRTETEKKPLIDALYNYRYKAGDEIIKEILPEYTAHYIEDFMDSVEAVKSFDLDY